MPKIVYIQKKFRAATLRAIEQANAIIEEYQAAGYSLALRQLYYQMVARVLIPNQQREYKRLGQIIKDARLAGLVDWNAIVDRTRAVRSKSHWDTPVGILKTCARQYQMDRWRDQDYRVEVWIEKDALVGVIAGVCNDLDSAYFSCRGYTSASAIWRAAMRFRRYDRDDKRTVVLHLADHDPSGIDMTRDVRDRLDLLTFMSGSIDVERIALTMDQVDEYTPPPNPAKVTDSRFAGYMAKYGGDSWELDALEPQVIEALIRDHIDEYRDVDDWEEKVLTEREHKDVLKGVTDDVAGDHGFPAVQWGDEY